MVVPRGRSSDQAQRMEHLCGSTEMLHKNFITSIPNIISSLGLYLFLINKHGIY